LATNRYLAKVASDMKKPDGLTILFEKDLPQSLYPLKLRELPGVGEQMESRLREAGIATVQQLCELSQPEMGRLWGGIQGERLWSWLRGKDTEASASHRYSIGHSHVLEPASRNAEGLFQIAKKLTSKAAARLRKEKFWASGLVLVIEIVDEGLWEGNARFVETQSTSRVLKALNDLWKNVPRKKPKSISITLRPLQPDQQHNLTLFENPKEEKISSVMDAINDKFGKNTAYFASLHDSLHEAPARIAFSRIPEADEF
jgi:DNA polymerase IV